MFSLLAHFNNILVFFSFFYECNLYLFVFCSESLHWKYENLVNFLPDYDIDEGNEMLVRLKSGANLPGSKY